jgi:molybdopterin converting factor small subunit
MRSFLPGFSERTDRASTKKRLKSWMERPVVCANIEQQQSYEGARTMPVKVLIPAPLRPYTDRQDSVSLDGGNVGDVLQQLTTRYSELKRHLYGDDGRLRNFVNVYVNDEDIRYLQKEETPISEKDTISIIPSIAGGA